MFAALSQPNRTPRRSAPSKTPTSNACTYAARAPCPINTRLHISKLHPSCYTDRPNFCKTHEPGGHASKPGFAVVMVTPELPSAFRRAPLSPSSPCRTWQQHTRPINACPPTRCMPALRREWQATPLHSKWRGTHFSTASVNRWCSLSDHFSRCFVILYGFLVGGGSVMCPGMAQNVFRLIQPCGVARQSQPRARLWRSRGTLAELNLCLCVSWSSACSATLLQLRLTRNLEILYEPIYVKNKYQETCGSPGRRSRIWAVRRTLVIAPDFGQPPNWQRYPRRNWGSPSSGVASNGRTVIRRS